MQVLKKLLSPNLGWIILIIIISSILWFLPAICGADYVQDNYEFRLFGFYTIGSFLPFWAHFIQFFLVLSIGFVILHITQHWQIIPLRSTIPFVIWLFLNSVIGRSQFFDEHSIAFLLFIGAFLHLLSMYGNSGYNSSPAFNIGFLITLASVFVPEYFFLILLFLVGMIVFGTLSFRPFLALILGGLVPIFLIFSGFFLTDKLSFLVEICKSSFFVLPTYSFPFLHSEMIFGILLFISFLIASVSYYSLSVNCKSHVRLNFLFINFAFWLSLGWSILFFTHFDAILFIPLLFICLVLSFYFSTNQSKFSNILFLVLLTAGLSYRILTLFEI